MDKKELVMDIFRKAGEIAKTADFAAAGLENYEVALLCNQGYIERIRKGFYQLPNGNDPKDETLLAELLPRGIICVESALFYYGYSDLAPHKWSIAVPRSFSRSIKAMGDFPIKAYYIQNTLYRCGATTGEFNGVTLSVYDRERTLCDCFKYRTRLDNELFNKAVNAYAADPKKNIANLLEYAKDMKVYKKMMGVMDVLLDD